MSEKSQIDKVKESKEKCRRHRDNWKREALRLRSIIEGLECYQKTALDESCAEYNKRTGSKAMCSNCKAKQRAKTEGEGE